MPNLEKQMPTTQPTVRIATKQAIYRMFRHFNYKAWTALGEFVDNSVSSYMKNRDRLREIEGDNYKLVLKINYNFQEDTLSIIDNAAGISENDYERAFALAEPPEDLRYISQYGVGMKVAGCWFANNWQVTSKAIGEDVQRTVEFDTESVAKGDLTSLPLKSSPAQRNRHYTHVLLRDLIHPPTGRTVEKVGNYLAKIYREFINNGEIEIYWQDEILEAPEYKVLVAPFHETPNASPQEWAHEFKFKLSTGQNVHGRAVVLSKFSRNDTALNLFWHNRLIKGNFEPNFRPQELFGSLQTHQSGRLCIDLHLDEFKPTVDKQNFAFEDTGASEDEIIDRLRELLRSPEARILQQASEYRLPKADEVRPAMELALNTAAEQLKTSATNILERPSNPLRDNPYPEISFEQFAGISKEILLDIEGRPWKVCISLSDTTKDKLFVDINEKAASNNENDPTEITITINYLHPFIFKYLSEETADVILGFAAALAFGEIAARRAGAKLPSFVRANMNNFLVSTAHSNGDQL